VSASNQPRLDLDDRKLYLKAKIEKTNVYGNSGWYIREYFDRLQLMIRTHDLGGTDYDHKEWLTVEEAEWLLQTPLFSKGIFTEGEPITIWELFPNCVKEFKERKPPLPPIGDYIGA
jgi:hypothetical protein